MILYIPACMSSYRSISSTGKDTKIWHFSVQFQPDARDILVIDINDRW